MSLTIAIKAYLQSEGRNEGEIHRFNFVVQENAANFAALKEKIISLFTHLRSNAANVQISYKDEEGDMIGLSSDEELTLALSMLGQDNLLRLYIGRSSNRCGRRRLEDGGSDLHMGVTCDGCDGAVRGFRYKCVVCPDYDLCSSCEGKQNHAQHLMLRLPTPSHMPWRKLFGGDGGGHCPFGKRRPHHQRHHQKHSDCEMKSSDNESDSQTEFPFQKLIENVAQQFTACAEQFGAGTSSGAAGGGDKTATQFPPPQELLKNVGDVVASFLNHIGVNADVQAEKMGGQREQCGGEPKAKDGEEEQQKDSNDVTMETDNNSAANRNGSSERETAEGWTYVAEKQNKPVNVESALNQMLAMGFNNEGGWLSRLLDAKYGNIDAVLEALAPVNKNKQ